MAIVSKIAKVASKKIGKAAAKNKAKGAATTKRVRDRVKKKKPLTEKQKEAAKRSAAYKKRVAANKEKREIEKLKVLARKVERNKVKKQKEGVAARSKGKISAAPTTGRAGEYSGGRLRRGRKSTDDGEERLSEIMLGREIKEYGGSGPAKKARGGEKVNVGKGVGGIDVGRFNPRELVAGSKKQKDALKKVIAIESKGKAATKEEKAFAKSYRKFFADQENRAIRKRAISRSESAKKAKKEKPADDFLDALKAAQETGELTPAYDRLRPNQQKQIERSVLARKQKEEREAAERKRFRIGSPPKSRTGNMDFRKGGLILSSVDNRKKKK